LHSDLCDLLSSMRIVCAQKWVCIADKIYSTPIIIQEKALRIWRGPWGSQRSPKGPKTPWSPWGVPYLKFNLLRSFLMHIRLISVMLWHIIWSPVWHLTVVWYTLAMGVSVSCNQAHFLLQERAWVW